MASGPGTGVEQCFLLPPKGRDPLSKGIVPQNICLIWSLLLWQCQVATDQVPTQHPWHCPARSSGEPRVGVQRGPCEGTSRPGSGALFAQVVFLLPGVSAALGRGRSPLAGLQVLEGSTSRVWESETRRALGLWSRLL